MYREIAISSLKYRFVIKITTEETQQVHEQLLLTISLSASLTEEQTGIVHR